MHLIIYGPEGSGKGTQAQLISSKLKIPVITSGDLVREKAKEKSPLGKICLSALVEGRYVDDDTMFKLWQEKLESPIAQKGFILDGFPRNVNQAKFLLDHIGKLNYSIANFIYIKISDEESFARLSKRNRNLFEGSTVSHDTPGRIKKRLEVFHGMEKPLVDFFRAKNLLLEIDGNHQIGEVFQTIAEKLGISV